MPPTTLDDLRVHVDEERPPRGRFVLVATTGEELGEMTFSRARRNLVIVDHTEVDDSVRGQGAGLRLFNAMVAWARANDTKVMSTCPFATAMFDRHPEARDVLG